MDAGQPSGSALFGRVIADVDEGALLAAYVDAIVGVLEGT
jgi:hypothetical protein